HPYRTRANLCREGGVSSLERTASSAVDAHPIGTPVCSVAERRQCWRPLSTPDASCTSWRTRLILCPGPDLNRHGGFCRRGILSPLCIPVSPPGLAAILYASGELNATGAMRRRGGRTLSAAVAALVRTEPKPGMICPPPNARRPKRPFSHEKNRSVAPRRIDLESGKPLYRLDRRRLEQEGRGRGAQRRQVAAEGRPGFRRRVHLCPQARDQDLVDRPGGNGPHVDPGAQILAPQRAPLRRAAGTQQGRDCSTVRRRAGQSLAARLRHASTCARAR